MLSTLLVNKMLKNKMMPAVAKSTIISFYDSMIVFLGSSDCARYTA